MIFNAKTKARISKHKEIYKQRHTRKLDTKPTCPDSGYMSK